MKPLVGKRMQLAMLRRDSGGHLAGRAVCGSEWTVAAWLGLVLVALLVGARQQLLDLSDTVLGKVGVCLRTCVVIACGIPSSSLAEANGACSLGGWRPSLDRLSSMADCLQCV